MPQYRVLDQRSDGVDLTLAAAAGYFHTWYEEDVPGTDDLDHVTAGVGIAVGRLMQMGDVRLGYVFQPTWSADGDDEITNDGDVRIHSAGLTYTLPFGRGFYASAAATSQHTSSLASLYDSDSFEGMLAFEYLGGRCHTLTPAATR